MLAKILNSGECIILSDPTISKINAIRIGFKELIEREKPLDFAFNEYKVVYEDAGEWIIKKYVRL